MREIACLPDYRFDLPRQSYRHMGFGLHLELYGAPSISITCRYTAVQDTYVRGIPSGVGHLHQNIKRKRLSKAILNLRNPWESRHWILSPTRDQLATQVEKVILAKVYEI